MGTITHAAAGGALGVSSDAPGLIARYEELIAK